MKVIAIMILQGSGETASMYREASLSARRMHSRRACSARQGTTKPPFLEEVSSAKIEGAICRSVVFRLSFGNYRPIYISAAAPIRSARRATRGWLLLE
jgi:hypothetical protein